MTILGVSFQCVGFHVIEPFTPMSKIWNVYVVRIMQVASRYPNAVALKWSTRCWLPKVYYKSPEIVSDRVACFTFALMKQGSPFRSLRQTKTLSCHFMGNGMIGRLKKMSRDAVEWICQKKNSPAGDVFYTGSFSLHSGANLRFSAFGLLCGP